MATYVPASLEAIIDENGSITSVIINEPGSGYVAPYVEFALPGPGGSQALTTAIIDSSGGIASVSIDFGGAGYTETTCQAFEQTGAVLPIVFSSDSVSTTDTAGNSVQLSPTGITFSSSNVTINSSVAVLAQSWFGFSTTNSSATSFNSGYTWNKVLFDAIGKNDISGLAVQGGGEYLLPIGSYHFLFNSHFSQSSDTRYIGFQYGDSASPASNYNLMPVYQELGNQVFSLSAVFSFASQTTFRCWTSGSRANSIVLPKNNILVITKLQ